ncbi:MAG: hypothetical protein GX494_13030 [Clostridiaceae bacterium]|nr:hypothetical protein [Clostridiaceae bacterium]
MSKKQAVKGDSSLAMFTKKQILKSKVFTHIEKDVLSVILNENEKYTIEQVKNLLEKFKEGKVK